MKSLLEIKEQKEGAHVFGTDIYRKCDNAFDTYRTDYNIPLGVVKSKYTIVQNNDAFNFFDDAIGKILLFGKLLDFGEMVREYL